MYAWSEVFVYLQTQVQVWNDNSHTSRRNYVHMIYAHIARLINERPGVSFYCRQHIHKNGHEKWMLCTDQCLWINSDILLEQKHLSENKYKNLKVEELGELFSLHNSVYHLYCHCAIKGKKQTVQQNVLMQLLNNTHTYTPTQEIVRCHLCILLKLMNSEACLLCYNHHPGKTPLYADFPFPCFRLQFENYILFTKHIPVYLEKEK